VFCRQFVNTIAEGNAQGFALLVHTDVLRSPKKKAGQRRSGIRAEEAKRREFEKLFERFRGAADAKKDQAAGRQTGADDFWLNGSESTLRKVATPRQANPLWRITCGTKQNCWKIP
jgi:hypothetical protein